MTAIIKNGVRVLTPAEYRALEAQIQKPSLRVLVRALLFTGMRYQELIRLKKEPSLFDPDHRMTVRVKSGKSRACQKERYVRLTPEGVEAVRAFLEDEREKYPSPAGIALNLVSWSKAAELEEVPEMVGEVYHQEKEAKDKKTGEMKVKSAGANEGMERKNVWGMSVKSFRKTWESWLTVTYPDQIDIITQSMGHEAVTAMKHYWGLPFTSDEKMDIRDMVKGWGGL